MTDAELVRHILARDKKALLQFYRQYQPKLSRYIESKIADPRDAEELLQDTLFAFLEACRDFAGNAKLQTFLFSICSHKIIDYYRRKKLKHIVFSRMPSLEMLVSPLHTPEESFDAHMAKEKIHRALERLLPEHRLVLLYKYMDSMSVASIAQKLATTVKSVEGKLFRAKKAFVEAFVSN